MKFEKMTVEFNDETFIYEVQGVYLETEKVTHGNPGFIQVKFFENFQPGYPLDTLRNEPCTITLNKTAFMCLGFVIIKTDDSESLDVLIAEVGAVVKS